MPKLPKQFGTAEDTETAFYDAIGRADLEAMMQLWAEDDDIVCIHPNGTRLVGHAAIRASWEAIFERGGVHIRPLQVHAVQNLMTAVHSVVEDVNRIGRDHKDMHLVATNIYVKSPQGWRIALHHASFAPGDLVADKVATNMLH